VPPTISAPSKVTKRKGDSSSAEAPSEINGLCGTASAPAVGRAKRQQQRGKQQIAAGDCPPKRRKGRAVGDTAILAGKAVAPLMVAFQAAAAKQDGKRRSEDVAPSVQRASQIFVPGSPCANATNQNNPQLSEISGIAQVEEQDKLVSVPSAPIAPIAASFRLAAAKRNAVASANHLRLTSAPPDVLPSPTICRHDPFVHSTPEDKECTAIAATHVPASHLIATISMDRLSTDIVVEEKSVGILMTPAPLAPLVSAFRAVAAKLDACAPHNMAASGSCESTAGDQLVIECGELVASSSREVVLPSKFREIGDTPPVETALSRASLPSISEMTSFPGGPSCLGASLASTVSGPATCEASAPGTPCHLSEKKRKRSVTGKFRRARQYRKVKKMVLSPSAAPLDHISGSPDNPIDRRTVESMYGALTRFMVPVVSTPIAPASPTDCNRGNSVSSSCECTTALWSFRHASSTLTDMMGKSWGRLFEWLQLRKRQPEDRCIKRVKRVALVTGPSGSGKSLGSLLVAKRVFGQNRSNRLGNVLLLSACEPEGRKLLESLIRRRTSIDVLIDAELANGAVVAIFDIDGADDSLKRLLARAARLSPIPIIYVCNHGVVSEEDALWSLSFRFEIQRPKAIEVARKLRDVAEREGVLSVFKPDGEHTGADDAELGVWTSFADLCACDFRRAINELQLLGALAMTGQGPAGSPPSAHSCCRKLLSCVELPSYEKLDLVSLDEEQVAMLVHENYIHAVCSADWCEDLCDSQDEDLGNMDAVLEHCADAAASIALGDVLSLHASKNAGWDDSGEQDNRGEWQAGISNPAGSLLSSVLPGLAVSRCGLRPLRHLIEPNVNVADLSYHSFLAQLTKQFGITPMQTSGHFLEWLASQPAKTHTDPVRVEHGFRAHIRKFF